ALLNALTFLQRPPRRGGRDPRGQEPRRVRRQSGLAEREPEVPRLRRLPRRRERHGRNADAGARDRLLEVPLRPGLARRCERSSADRAARLRKALHERLPAAPMTDARRLVPPLILVGVFLVGWELYARVSGVRPLALRAPSSRLC